MKKNVRISLLPENRAVADQVLSDCHTCINRRIKCDRSSPHCKKCATRELKCPGYSSRRFRWAPIVIPGDSTARVRRPRQTDRPLTNHSVSQQELWWTDHFATATLSTHLLDHFFHNTARRLVWLDEYSNPWRSHIWPLSERSPLLRACLLTLSSAHIAAMSGKDLDSQIYRASRDASLRALSLNIGHDLMRSDCQENYTEVLVAIVTLYYGDLFIKNTPDQALHLYACRIAVDTGLLLQKRIGILDEVLQFAVKEAKDLEANAHMFSFHDDAVFRAPELVPEKKPLNSFWSFTGYIHEVTVAERELHTTLLKKASPSARGLESWILKLNSARDSILAEFSLKNGSSLTCTGKLKEASPLETIIHLNYLGCFIYTYQSLLPTTPEFLHLNSAKSSLLNNINRLANDPTFLDSFAHDIYWPLFIAGTISLSDRDGQNAITHAFLRGIEKTGLWCNYGALQFLRVFWDAEDEESIDWMAFARRRMVMRYRFVFSASPSVSHYPASPDWDQMPNTTLGLHTLNASAEEHSRLTVIMAPFTYTPFLLPLLVTALSGSWDALTTAQPVTRQTSEPDEYTANNNIGPGGSIYLDSAHFRIFGNSGNEASEALGKLEAAFECFVRDLNFRSSGLSFNGDTEPWTKTNIYSVAELANAAGVQHSDPATGMGYVEVQQDYLTASEVTVHEWGHVLHYHQQTWVDQTRTGAWWEMFANWIADTYRTSDLCAAARENHDQPTEATMIDLPKIIGDSFQVIVDGTPNSGNYYQSWPFLTYLTNNLDGFPNLGEDTLHQMMVQYDEGSNETPLHTLQRVAGDTPVAEIVGQYWARMAFVDIGHPSATQAFENTKSQINYENVQSSGDGSYRVIAARQPRYMGSNIIPLSITGGTVSVEITANAAYTATLVLSSSNGISYIGVDGSGSVEAAAGDQLSLVVANTPQELLLYDAFDLSPDVQQGLDYSFALSGAEVI
ncbi:hypothetical protein Q7P37_004890 [Cladosporium fusiforme]